MRLCLELFLYMYKMHHLCGANLQAASELGSFYKKTSILFNFEPPSPPEKNTTVLNRFFFLLKSYILCQFGTLLPPIHPRKKHM